MSVAENPHLSPAPTPSGRDAKGRFTANNPGGPGNPFARRVAALRTALLQNVTAEDLVAIVRAMIAQAQQGNVAAAKLVFAYVLGQPAKAFDPDHLDIDEWQNFKETTNMYAEMPRVGMAPEPELPLKMVRFSRPVMTELCGQQMKEMLQQPPADAEAPLSQESPGDDSPPSPNGEAAAAEGPPAARRPAKPMDAPPGVELPPFESDLPPELWAALLDLATPSAIGDNGDRLRHGRRKASKPRSAG
jgi:hypothetical protein